MRYLDLFTGYLREYETTYPLPAFDESIQQIEAVGKQVEKKLKDVVMGEPNPQLVQQTIKKFFDWASVRTTTKFSWLEVALLCRGLLVETPDNCTLIQSSTAFKTFIGRFIRIHKEYVMSSYCWQGLLNAYLNSSPSQDPSITDNWHELRLFLQDTLDTVAGQSRFKPRWLDALIEHRIVLAENATQSLAQEALQGQRERVDRIAHEVNIPSTSWFWPELLMSQVAVVIAYSDEAFKSSVNLILAQLKEREECLDEGVSKILDRYVKCANAEPHQELKIMAVSRWKSPSLERQSGWVRVSPEAKRMVQRWLVVEDLKDFFLTLRQESDDDSLDRRRFEFWMQYLDQISYSFLILGPDTRTSFQYLLTEKVGRYSSLTGTNRANNAFLIRIGTSYIVEFGGIGKTWAYGEAKILPLLNYKSVRYDDLRAPYRSLFNGYVEAKDGGLSHQGSWEEKFHRALSYLNISPDTIGLDEFLKRYQIKFEKLPSGTLMVRHFYSDGTVANFLRKQGFRFKSRVDGFYLNPHSMSSY
jgi:hypothetical protein